MKPKKEKTPFKLISNFCSPTLQCLDSVGVVISTPCLIESEESCRFLAELASYHREWRLHLPQVLNRLMVS